MNTLPPIPKPFVIIIVQRLPLVMGQKISALRPVKQGRKAQALRGTTRIRAPRRARTHSPVTAEKTVLLSQAAPGRTKRRWPGRLSASGRPSLRALKPVIFPFLACIAYYL